ncbi:uncharacterized protein IL334_000032 [Kwoniella shivajii]|uniref:Aspartate aminotransferase n=1 Tax=Kwoniella shivajii TaxID=564305 RepID=A0ABZ1CN08_9TREE|nr:hypothetical protein IL334_000032 [Kwoniella shivajii]
MNVLKDRLAADDHPKKVNLAPGTYRCESGQPWILPCFRLAAERLLADRGYDHEYLGLLGHPKFLHYARELVLGPKVDTSTIASLQTVGGTGAVHMGALILKLFSDRPSTVFISDPTWVNHHDVFQHAGWRTESYRYYDSVNKSLDFGSFVQSLRTAPSRSIYVLHAVGHNPTGCDPSLEQWRALAQLFKEKDHFAFFDCAYQGFVSGNLEQDRQAVELFASHGIAMCVAQSLSKNAGMYGERLGALHVFCGTVSSTKLVKQQLKVLTRREISCAPKYGADLVSTVCSDPKLRAMWDSDLKHISGRIIAMRHGLFDRLVKLETPGDWSHIIRQRGMFAYSGLTPEQCNALVDDYHIYVPRTGRMMMAGLNEDNLDYVAEAIHRVVVDHE